MRVLAITNMYPSAAFPGRGVFVEEQLRGLGLIGVRVRSVFIDRRQEGPLTYYRMGRQISEALAEFDPEVIHAMYGGVMADQIARHFRARPLVVTFHGSDLLGENLSGWVRKLISSYGVHCSRRAARAAEGVVVVARHLLTALNGAAVPDKVRVIPCGIDLDRFHPLDSARCKHHLAWNPQAFHVLFASSNGDPVKRPWLAQAAVDHLKEEGIPAELHSLTGISNTDVPVWLSASDALLLTSRHEGSPTIVKEALGCNLPVVSVEVGDVAERIEGIEGCHLARPHPVDLAAKLAWVRRRGKRLDCRGQLETLSIQHIAQQLREFYQHLVDRNGTTRPLVVPSVGRTVGCSLT